MRGQVLKEAVRLPRLAWKSAAALRHARRERIPGLRFDGFGRRLGTRLLARGDAYGARLVLNPVSIVRYFEFEFAAEAIGADARSCIDISSPRLFPLWLAVTRPALHIRMRNPDPIDMARTNAIIRRLGLRGIDTAVAGADRLQAEPPADVVLSISVIEHISGVYDDIEAIRWMWEAVAPGGRLVLTFPVDRQPWDEYRGDAPYQPGVTIGADGAFFSRYYVPETIEERLLRPIGRPQHHLAFFGERTQGHYIEYSRRWKRHGLAATVDDPREIAEHYRWYSSWEDMPGRGVCGLVIDKAS